MGKLFGHYCTSTVMIFNKSNIGNFLKMSSGTKCKKCRSLFSRVLGEVVHGRDRVGDAN
jgi:hypothetical protein